MKIYWNDFNESQSLFHAIIKEEFVQNKFNKKIWVGEERIIRNE